MYQDGQFEKVIPPCVEIKKVDVEFEENIGDSSKNEFSNDFYEKFAQKAGTKQGWFIIHLHFWSSIDFKEIKQIRAYPIMSAIGNASGYVGVLVGASLPQIPFLIFWAVSKMKRAFSKWKKMKQFCNHFKQLRSASETESSTKTRCEPDMSDRPGRDEGSNLSDETYQNTENYILETLV